ERGAGDEKPEPSPIRAGHRGEEGQQRERDVGDYPEGILEPDMRRRRARERDDAHKREIGAQVRRGEQVGAAIVPKVREAEMGGPRLIDSRKLVALAKLERAVEAQLVVEEKARHHEADG